MPLSTLASGYCLMQRLTVHRSAKVTWSGQLRLGYLYQLPTTQGSGIFQKKGRRESKGLWVGKRAVLLTSGHNLAVAGKTLARMGTLHCPQRYQRSVGQFTAVEGGTITLIWGCGHKSMSIWVALTGLGVANNIGNKEDLRLEIWWRSLGAGRS